MPSQPKKPVAKPPAAVTAPAKGKAKSETSGAAKIARRKKPARKTTYNRFIYRVLKQVHNDLGISAKGMSVMNSFVEDLFSRLSSEAARLNKYAGRRVLKATDIQGASRLLLPGELAKHAISEGTKAVQKFTAKE